VGAKIENGHPRSGAAVASFPYGISLTLCTYHRCIRRQSKRRCR
jgi:hypothetical protein